MTTFGQKLIFPQFELTSPLVTRTQRSVFPGTSVGLFATSEAMFHNSKAPSEVFKVRIPPKILDGRGLCSRYPLAR